MYDLVRKTFLTNVGNSLDFAIGPLVNTDVKNQMPISTNEDGSLYNNGLGYKDGYRVRSSGEEVEYGEYASCTGYMPFKKGETLEIFPAFTGENTNNAINFFDANHTCLGQITDYGGSAYGICENNIELYRPTTVDHKSVLTLTDAHDDRIAYIRVTHNIYVDSFISSGEAMIITVTKEETNLLDMSKRTIYTGYTDNYIETTSTHEMDYTKIYALDPTYRRGAYPTSKFTGLTVLDNNGFSVSCSSDSGYKLSFPIDVQAGKTYKLTMSLTTPGYIKLMKYNNDKTFNNVDTNLITTTGNSSCTFTVESGYYYAIVFPYANDTRVYEDISLIEV
jgi:hypothetical protein